MSNYKLTFQLKQHTPMIHFQTDQQGATLRATELKPKLDRFIIEREGLTEILEGKEVPKKEYKNWFISTQHLALNYRVRVKACSLISDKIMRNNDKLPTFFGNMGEDYNDSSKFLSKTNEYLVVEIFVRPSRLKKAIEDYISSFFWSTNFGTRQSKGFGCFTLRNEDFQSFHFDLTFKIDAKRSPKFFLNRNSPERWQQDLNLFGAIEIFYKSLRSGINRKGREGVPKFYIKPAIFYYSMLKLKRQWDKKSIKDYYLNSALITQKVEHNEPDILSYADNQIPKSLIKDVFGLSSSESWLSYSKQLEKSNSEIDRFGSPLLFKPFDHGNGQYTIGIKCGEIHPDFLGAVFNITFGNARGLQLEVPEEFEWADFWNFYMNSLPQLTDRLGDFPNQENEAEFKILSAIDETLKLTTS